MLPTRAAIDDCGHACRRRRPHAIKQQADGLWRLCHRVIQPVMCEGLIPEQPRALGSQGHYFRDDCLIVIRIIAVAAPDPRAKYFFAQIAPRGELQKRLDAGAREGDEVPA